MAAVRVLSAGARQHRQLSRFCRFSLYLYVPVTYCSLSALPEREWPSRRVLVIPFPEGLSPSCRLLLVQRLVPTSSH